MSKVLVINPILYTAESNRIPKVDSIKDTMIYTLCLGFLEAGHEATLLERLSSQEGRNLSISYLMVSDGLAQAVPAQMLPLYACFA